MNRTKIIATVGPGCDDKSVMQDLVNRGVNCFRINLSHGTEDQKRHYFNLVKSLEKPSGLRPSILADIAGPKIRVKGLNEKIKIKNKEAPPSCVMFSRLNLKPKKLTPNFKTGSEASQIPFSKDFLFDR